MKKKRRKLRAQIRMVIAMESTVHPARIAMMTMLIPGTPAIPVRMTTATTITNCATHMMASTARTAMMILAMTLLV